MRVTALFHFIFHLIFVIYVFLLFITNCAMLPMLLTTTIEFTYCRLFFCHQCNSNGYLYKILQFQVPLLGKVDPEEH